MTSISTSQVPQRGLPRPLSGNPGNLFLRGETVRVQLPSAAPWICLDYDRIVVEEGEGRTADLGEMPVGYYEIYPRDKSVLAPGEQPPWPVAVGVLEGLKVPVPLDSPIAVDGALSGFYGDGERTRALEIGANQAALAGINWIRDRVSWPTMHPGPGQFAGQTEYDHGVRIQAAAGLRVLQVPLPRPSQWIERDGPVRYPFDLRDLYGFFAGMSARWKDSVSAWEPWIEPEWVAFGGHTGAETAAVQKAAFWAIRKGHPDARVSLIALTGEYPDHLENLVENEPWPYFDTFNYHQYFNLVGRPETYRRLRQAAAGRPVWITESGIELRWQGPDSSGELTWEDQVRQARHVPRVFAVNLHQRVEAVFFFLLPHYAEGRNQFGITRSDYSPRPAYVALAAAGRLLAGARPLGRRKFPGHPFLNSYHFAALPDGRACEVTVLWSEGPRISIPVPGKERLLSVFDFLGRERSQPGGELVVGPEALYLLHESGVAGALPLQDPPGKGDWLPGQPCPLVLQPRPHPAQVVMGTSHYSFQPDTVTAFPVHAYNFSDQPVEARIRVESAEGFQVSLATGMVTLAPMERVDLNLKVQSGAAPRYLGSRPVTIRADCGEAGQTLLVLRFTHVREAVEPVEHIPLASGNLARNWVPGSNAGTVEGEAIEAGGLRWTGRFPDDRGHSLHVEMAVPDPERATASIGGLAFTVVPRRHIARFDVQFREESGETYWGYGFLPNESQLDQPHRCVVLFDKLEDTTWPREVRANRMDPRKVVRLRINCTANAETVAFDLRDLAWVG